ncbi:helix-turn-helix domain-containing protein [Acinetobacter haemolyticus]|uniref:helix-turn-helix domain-containing protein n=1 Tax=Acinetobacter haemolyticus TaxID=29430 RepID=UPI0013724FD9|nr:helix-turn-helix domain-containing protein [Acinetobacter haemolyticus]NAR31120.1 helix-turn-helix domain-containing protein [Acinetobacter haemolyticus]
MAVLSTDLRTRVIAAYETSLNKRQVCLRFNIARTTLDDWIKLKAQTGRLDQVKWDRGPKTQIKDWDRFKVFVEQARFDTVKQLVPLYEQYFNQSIEYKTLLRAMHRIGWTVKKRLLPTGKPTL